MFLLEACLKYLEKLWMVWVMTRHYKFFAAAKGGVESIKSLCYPRFTFRYRVLLVKTYHSFYAFYDFTSAINFEYFLWQKVRHKFAIYFTDISWNRQDLILFIRRSQPKVHFLHWIRIQDDTISHISLGALFLQRNKKWLWKIWN